MARHVASSKLALTVAVLLCAHGWPEAELLAASQAQGTKAGAAATPSRALDRALLDKYCVMCHNDRLKTADFSLETLDLGRVEANAEALEKIVRKLRSGQMPPEGRPQPDGLAVTAFVTALERRLDEAAAARPDPGRVASRRLNRAEYVHAIRDLLALDVDGAELLPSDMAGFGFDNNADVLSITPGLMARYMSAATKISRVALASPENRPITQVYKNDLGVKQDGRMHEDMPLGTHGGLASRHSFPLDGEYVFRIRLVRNATVGTIEGIEEDEHEIEVRVDHALVKKFTVGGRHRGPDPGVLIAVPEDDVEGKKVHDYRLNADRELEVRVPIKAGVRLVAAAFTNSLPSPLATARLRGRRDGGAVGIDTLAISGPFNAQSGGDTPSRRLVLSCRPATARDEEPCARKIVTSLARRAYRRPVTDADIAPLMTLYGTGRAQRDFDAGIERALEAMLASPKFLIRLEREPAGLALGSSYRLSDLELASRLSFFLWRSIPDDELIGLAERGRLSDPTVLARQVPRMLADRRSSRFLNDFVGQWLQVRNIQAQVPDMNLYPDFEDTLRQAMARETELFFESQVRDDRPITELLTANYTFLNERLARHYGVPGVYGSRLRRVTLADERRMGLLGHGSILTVSSYAHRTSVVLRGKWVLETLLGAPPPPPPANVPPLKENDGRSKPTALRERMEAHRANPVCASCHARMDPLGFALEHFDAIGKWRTTDDGAPINATINWAGRTVDSPKAFREALVARSDEYVRNMVEKLLTYALGRGVDYADAPIVRQIARDLDRQGRRWSALLVGIVSSPQFQMRRVTGASVSPASVAQ